MGVPCEEASLEWLYEDHLGLALDEDVDPVGFGEGVAGEKKPIDEEIMLYIRAVEDWALLLEELPKYIGNVVAAFGDEKSQGCGGGGCDGGETAIGVEHLIDDVTSMVGGRLV